MTKKSHEVVQQTAQGTNLISLGSPTIETIPEADDREIVKKIIMNDLGNTNSPSSLEGEKDNDQSNKRELSLLTPKFIVFSLEGRYTM